MSSHRAQITELDDGIVAIDTEYLRPIQDASHLIVAGGRAAFVDTGTNDSVPLLIDALDQRNLDVADVDYVFLTHIHLDHAGGAGLLMQALPNALCIVHPRGAPPMIDPARLIAGAEAVYGSARTRVRYGLLRPLEESRISVPGAADGLAVTGRGFKGLGTEGHARHHYCLNDPTSRGVFTGDSFGVSYRELDTVAGEFIFPTTTPASFDPDEAHKSVDRIMGCEPERLYLTHYSRITDLDRLAADMHADIDAYCEMALANKGADDPAAAIRVAMYDYLAARLLAHGYGGDAAAMHSVLDIDLALNAQGLVSWLRRLEKQG